MANKRTKEDEGGKGQEREQKEEGATYGFNLYTKAKLAKDRRQKTSGLVGCSIILKCKVLYMITDLIRPIPCLKDPRSSSAA